MASNVKKRIVLFFGEMGSGKSYLGKRYAEENDLTFVEGDRLLSPEMRARVERFLPPTKEQLDSLIESLRTNVATLARVLPRGVVVSQALYRNEHRQALIDFWGSAGYEVTCFWVRPSFRQNMDQLLSRRRGFRWVLYWLVSKPWFQSPSHPAVELLNARQ